MIRVGLAIALLAALVAEPAQAQKAKTFLDYHIHESREGATDDREILTSMSLTEAFGLGFRYEERVKGATDPVVKAVRFSNETIDVSAADRKVLFQKLSDAGVFDLPEMPKPEDGAPQYYLYLTIRIDDREAKYNYGTPPVAGKRLAVDAILRDFASQMKADQPSDIDAATSISEGDLQPARQVTFAELLAHPEDYDGKRVSVVGHYQKAYESSAFCTDEFAGVKHGYDGCIWRGENSTFAEPSAIDDGSGWQRIDGVFHKGDAYFGEDWPTTIDRLTRVEPAKRP